MNNSFRETVDEELSYLKWTEQDKKTVHDEMIAYASSKIRRSVLYWLHSLFIHKKRHVEMNNNGSNESNRSIEMVCVEKR